MIYGQHHRSKEVDLVIWDAQNYPSLPLLDHSFFFVDSVKVALESKSKYTAKEMSDALQKSKSVRDIVPPPTYNLDDFLSMLKLDVECLKAGKTHGGMMFSKHHVGTAAIFLTGGKLKSLEKQAMREGSELDFTWPDVLLLLEPGLVAIKSPVSNTEGIIEFVEAKDDSLFVFTSVFLNLLRSRIVSVEAPHFMLEYVRDFSPPVAKTIGFRRWHIGLDRFPLSGERLQVPESD